MTTKGELPKALCAATSAILRAQRLVTQPESREKWNEAELRVRCVMLSECHGIEPKVKGHHGG